MNSEQLISQAITTGVEQAIRSIFGTQFPPAKINGPSVNPETILQAIKEGITEGVIRSGKVFNLMDVPRETQEKKS